MEIEVDRRVRVLVGRCEELFAVGPLEKLTADAITEIIWCHVRIQILRMLKVPFLEKLVRRQVWILLPFFFKIVETLQGPRIPFEDVPEADPILSAGIAPRKDGEKNAIKAGCVLIRILQIGIVMFGSHAFIIVRVRVDALEGLVDAHFV